MALISEPLFQNRLWKFDVPTLIASAAHGYCDQSGIPLHPAVHYVANLVPTAVQTAFGVAANEIERAPYWCSKRMSTSVKNAVEDAMDVARDKLVTRATAIALHGGVGAAETLMGYWGRRGLRVAQDNIIPLIEQLLR